MMLSGAFGAGAGLTILSAFPKLSLWMLVLLLGIDFLTQGLAWLRFAFSPRLARGGNGTDRPLA
jgi:uncharacterized membrane protein HdeD (DUF308 family)